jgi:2-amino-4-hydroxy-6-hydroxymethyldihydropteridine diphosphokinase
MILLEPAFISIGSNIQPEKNLPQAVAALQQLGKLLCVSQVYQNPAIGSVGQDDFLNAAALINSPHPPQEIRYQLRMIEARLGRVRQQDKFAPRTIDLDLAILGDQIIETPEFILPDPEILNRAHLAVPLAELDPTYVHPVTNELLSEIAERLRSGANLQLREDVTSMLAAMVENTNS